MLPKRPLIICCDFDHTIVNGSEVLPGAKEALTKIHEQGHHILIHSCNNLEWIRLVLNNNDIPYDDVWEGKGKPVADWYVDDKGVNFKPGAWPAILEIMGIEE